MKLTRGGQRAWKFNVRNGYDRVQYAYVCTFEGHSIFLDGVDGSIGNDRLASLHNGCNVDLLPLDWNLTECCQTIKMHIRKHVLLQRCKYPLWIH